MYQYFIPVCCWRILNIVSYFSSSHCLFSSRMVAFLTVRSPGKHSSFCCYSLSAVSNVCLLTVLYRKCCIWLITLSPLTSYRYFELIRHFGIYFFYLCSLRHFVQLNRFTGDRLNLTTDFNKRHTCHGISDLSVFSFISSWTGWQFFSEIVSLMYQLTIFSSNS